MTISTRILSAIRDILPARATPAPVPTRTLGSLKTTHALLDTQDPDAIPLLIERNLDTQDPDATPLLMERNLYIPLVQATIPLHM